eukprot:m.107029 g.107029  ORF g.107029 m.107029 type:complete len:343 (-) comp8964_c0_seq1:1754-2782(-)
MVVHEMAELAVLDLKLALEGGQRQLVDLGAGAALCLGESGLVPLALVLELLAQRLGTLLGRLGIALQDLQSSGPGSSLVVVVRTHIEKLRLGCIQGRAQCSGDLLSLAELGGHGKLLVLQRALLVRERAQQLALLLADALLDRILHLVLVFLELILQTGDGHVLVLQVCELGAILLDCVHQPLVCELQLLARCHAGLRNDGGIDQRHWIRSDGELLVDREECCLGTLAPLGERVDLLLEPLDETRDLLADILRCAGAKSLRSLHELLPRLLGLLAALANLLRVPVQVLLHRGQVQRSPKLYRLIRHSKSVKRKKVHSGHSVRFRAHLIKSCDWVRSRCLLHG